MPERLAVLAVRDQAPGSLATRLGSGAIATALDDGVTLALVPDASAPGRRAQLAVAVGQGPAWLGPEVPWEEAPVAARIARLGLDLGAPDGEDAGGLHCADDHLAHLLLHADRDLARLAAGRALAPLDALGSGARARCARRCAPGSTTRAASRPPPPRSASTPRRSATGSCACARFSASRSRTPRRGSRSRWPLRASIRTD